MLQDRLFLYPRHFLFITRRWATCFFTFHSCFQRINQIPLFQCLYSKPQAGERWDLVTPSGKSTGICCLFCFNLGDFWHLSNQAAMCGLYHYFFSIKIGSIIIPHAFLHQCVFVKSNLIKFILGGNGKSIIQCDRIQQITP